MPSRQNSAARLTVFVLVIITIDHGFPPSYEYVYSHGFQVPPTARNLYACIFLMPITTMGAGLEARLQLLQS